MPWTDVPDFTVGQVLTSTRMNQMRNNDNIGHRVCTSATRPSSPDEGAMIYETDTDKVYVWSGSAWVEVPLANAGAIAHSLMPSGSVIQVGRYGWTNETSVNGSGSGWVTATNSSYSFTPRFSTSTILIQFEWAMAPYHPGNTYAGMSCRGLWGGNVVTVQGQSHEVYVATVGSSADLYSRTVKSISFTANTTSPTAITTQVSVYLATTNGRLNQNANWSSYYTVWEIKA